MLKVIREQIVRILDDIDTGNTNITPEQSIQVAEFLNEMTTTKKLYNRTKAAEYLNCSVQSLDLYRKDGTLEEGKKEKGGVIQWTKKQLDDCIERRRRNDNTKKNTETVKKMKRVLESLLKMKSY